MMKQIARAAACGSLLALGACGGGESGDRDGEDRLPFSLETQSGALRELSLAGLVLDGVPETLPEAAAAAARKSAGGSWGGIPLRRIGQPQAKAEPCPLGGNYDEISGSRTRSFVYFSQTSATVNFKRETDTGCLHPSPTDEVPPPASGVDRYNGTFEEGLSAVLGDGSQLGYVIDGTDNGSYLVTRTVSSGRNGYTEIEGYRGTAEQREAQDGSRDLRAIYRYSYNYEDSDEDYFRFVQLGTGTTPFTGTANAQGNALRLNGTYAYETSECEGGQTVVSTELPIGFSGQGYPAEGRIRLTSSSGKFAVFSFNNDGSATLNLNGASRTVSAGELRAALDESGC